VSTSPAREQLEDAILEAVVRMIAGTILFNHEVAEKIGLGPSDLQFLTLLQVHGALTPGRLAELSGLSTGTVTGVVDRLEKAGYARRDRAADDRRKVIVSLDNERMQKEVGPMYAQKAEQLLATLKRYDERQLAVIADFTKQLAQG
jgi:DNA-binding MarR family transcriptional regulator